MENISIVDARPMSDEVGKTNPAYEFSLVNEDQEDLEYTIYLKEEEFENKTPAGVIRYNYKRDIGSIDITRGMEESKTEEGRYYLETGVIESKTTYQYEYRMWLSEEAGNEVKGTEYSIRIEIEAEQTFHSTYKEIILNGCDPVLSDNLMPVVIEDDGTVKKADLYQEWYNYSNKRWANAIVLEDKSQEYTEGQVIPESNIRSYFVWIPKYGYELWDLGEYSELTTMDNTKVHVIPIKFGKNDTKDSNDGECTTSGVSGESGNCKVGDYMTHPAFQAFDTNGFWVGKFESGYKGATSTAGAEQNNSNSSNLIIKPNVYSWRNITVGNAFKASYDYLREDESHMMKNTEWGAVAYLQHSSYGSSKKVRINNNSSFLTGYASVTEPSCGHGGNHSCNQNGTDASVTQPYNTEIGYTASTTENITRIYDMSGGVNEVLMAYGGNNYNGASSEILSLYSDFFTNNRWSKYYDKYSSVSDVSYNSRILGDATGEIGPFGLDEDMDGVSRRSSSWYNEWSDFIFNGWSVRGSSYYHGKRAGIFTFSGISGETNRHMTFRLVLIPKN